MTVNVYLRNNPWKLSIHNREQKIFRYCVLCNTNRFSDAEWNKLITTTDSSICCNNKNCWSRCKELWELMGEDQFENPFCLLREYEILMKEQSFNQISYMFLKIYKIEFKYNFFLDK